ncbi:MAG: hypothetical protein V1792_23575 [Pseudomonadota bacterium]
MIPIDSEEDREIRERVRMNLEERRRKSLNTPGGGAIIMLPDGTWKSESDKSQLARLKSADND